MNSVEGYWLSVPKAGREDHENEDVATRRDVRTERLETALVGIADGVSDTIYSGRWAAALLADTEWPRLFQPERFLVEDTLARWQAGALSSLDVPTGADLPWYLRAKAQRGSAATFLGVRLRRERREGARIEVDIVSIGDCGAFLFRDGTVVAQFPALSAAEYGNTPDSVHNRKRTPETSLLRATRSWRLRRGETLLLATDAMAQWLAVESDADLADRIERLLTCSGDTEFARLVRDERLRGTLRDDDSTVVVLSRRA